MRITLIFLLIIGLKTEAAVVQHPDVNLSLEFSYDMELSKQYMFHNFVPVSANAIAFAKDGTPAPLSVTDTVMITSVERGTYQGHSGTWLVQRKEEDNNTYILFNQDLKEVTEEVHLRNHVAFDGKVKQRVLNLMYATVPFLLIGLLVWRMSPGRVGLPEFLLKNKSGV